MPRRLRVLIADDEAAIRLMCRVNLEIEGIDVVEAADGREALDLVLADPPDVVLLDISMPRRTGWQVADAIRQEPACRKVAIIFMSASVTGRSREEAERRGHTLLTKPFNPLDLAALVRAAAH
jgi:CheY-like chemotaxis protein